MALIIGVVVLLFMIATASSLYRYWSWHLKVWDAKIVVDGTPSPKSAVYLDVRRQHNNGVLVRRDASGEELYAFGLGSANTWKYVWRCEEHSFFFLPGLAYSNHVQFGRGCMATNIVMADDTGKQLGKSQHSLREVTLQNRLIQFTAEDGKRVRAEW